jgi:hypothetical protein
MRIVELSRAEHHSEEKKASVRKGTIVIENLYPEKKDERRSRNTEAELYRIFSKYKIRR